jgi:hypothetical protein
MNFDPAIAADSSYHAEIGDRPFVPLENYAFVHAGACRTAVLPDDFDEVVVILPVLVCSASAPKGLAGGKVELELYAVVGIVQDDLLVGLRDRSKPVASFLVVFDPLAWASLTHLAHELRPAIGDQAPAVGIVRQLSQLMGHRARAANDARNRHFRQPVPVEIGIEPIHLEVHAGRLHGKAWDAAFVAEEDEPLWMPRKALQAGFDGSGGGITFDADDFAILPLGKAPDLLEEPLGVVWIFLL